MANSTNKLNDFIAASINGGENVTLDDLRYYNITPDNTGIQSEDYYKRIPQVQELFTKDGKFDEDLYDAWYKDNLDLYNTWSNEDYEGKLIDAIERSPYDIFHTDNTNVEDISTKIISARDPERTARGLTYTGSNNGATFDIREVAQANYVLDENGNELDWTPNDKGGFWKGLWRPSLALATWDEDGYHYENGMKVEHHAGDIRYGANGDPCYQVLGNRSAVGKDVLHYTDTFTADDSLLNKFDFFDNDGLKKSVGGTLMRTAVLLAPMFIPGVNTAFGWGGAALALAQTAPVLARSIDGAITGDNENGFGQFMNRWENMFNRFGTTTSREAQNSFFSKENLADMVISSANQLFQQRNIINASRNLIKLTDAKKAQKLGSAISLGYMAATSSNDTYATFKQAGLDDRWASIGTLAVTLGLYGLMDSGYLFKDAMFKNTWLAEDQERRQLLKTLADYGKTNLKLAESNAKGALGVAAEKAVAKKWYTKVKDGVVNFLKKGETKYQNELMEAAKKGDLLSVRLSETPFWQAILGRGLNEGIEEVMEEGVTDSYKLFTLGLDELGFNVTEKNKDLDFKETWADILGRYATAFVGGYIGGMTFEGFSEWDKLVRNNFKRNTVDRSLVKNLVATISNPETRADLDDAIDEMEKKGLFGNKNLSAKFTTEYDDSDPTKVTNLVFGQGTDEDNQNKAVAAATRYLVNNIKSVIDDESIHPYDVIRMKINQDIMEKAENKGMSVDEYLKSEGLNDGSIAMFELSQKGALDGVYNEMVEKSVDIVTKELAIRQRKADIKKSSGDANKEEAKQAIAKDVTIKQLEKEKEQLKKEYEELYNGERSDYYASVINFASNGIKMMPYIFDTNLFTEKEEDILPISNFQDYVEFKYGVKIDDPNLDEKYVDAKKKEWENYKESILPKQIWKAHQLHYALSEQLTNKFNSINTELQGFKTESNEYDVKLRTLDSCIEALSAKIATEINPELKVGMETAMRALKEARQELLDSKDELIALSSSSAEEDRRKYKIGKDLLQTKLDQADAALNAVIGWDGYLNILKINYQKIIDDKIISNIDFSDINSYGRKLGNAIEQFNNLTIPVDEASQSLSDFILKSCYSHLASGFGENIKGSVDYALWMAINLRDASGKYIGIAKQSLEFIKKIFNVTENDDAIAEQAIINDSRFKEHMLAWANVIVSLVNNVTQNPENEDELVINDSDIKSIIEAALQNSGDPDFEEDFDDFVNEILGETVTEQEARQKAIGDAALAFRKYCEKNQLISKENIRNELKQNMQALEMALKNSDFIAAESNYNAAWNLFHNTLSDTDMQDAFDKYLFTSMQGDELVTEENFDDVLRQFFEFRNKTNGTLSKVKRNPIWDLLKQISTYTNGKFTYAVDAVRAELERFEKLGDDAMEEYVINEPAIINELETTLRLLNLERSLISSTVDGHNVIINQYRSLTGKSPFAIINENTNNILGQGMQEVQNLVRGLLEISKKNALKQMKLQKDTFINCYPKLAEKTFQLVNACNEIIKAHGDDEDKKYLLTDGEVNELSYTIPDNLNEINFNEEKKRIDDFYSKLREIILKKKSDVSVSDEDFIKNYLKLIIKNTPTLYQMIQTELSPSTSTITDFTGFQNLVTNILDDAKTVDAIYNSVRNEDRFKDLWPFMGQELMLKTAFVFGRHTSAITELEEALQEQGKTPNLTNGDGESKRSAIEGLQKRQILKGVIHFDGTAGAGKTELTRMLGAMFEAQKPDSKVIQVYSAVNKDHIDNNLKPRLGEDSYKYAYITEIVNEALGGKAPESYDGLKGEKDGDVWKEGTEKRALADYVENEWLNSDKNPFKDAESDAVKIWVIDEDGFLTPAQWEVVTALAEKAGAFIVGTGDSFQNGAVTHADGQMHAKDVYDYYTWTTPFLSISMRAQNKGKLQNQQFFYSTIKEINSKFTYPFYRFVEEADENAKIVLNSKQNVLYGYKTENEIFGEVQVDSAKDAVALAKKLSKDHSLIIVTDRKNAWSIPELTGSNIKIMDRDSVQGGQADYVIVDRNDWDDNAYFALKDLYTMASRSKIGTAFIKNDVFSKLNIVFNENENAKFTPSPEAKRNEIESYKQWREKLFNETSRSWTKGTDNIDGSTPPAGGSPTGTSGTPPAGGSGGGAPGGGTSGGSSPGSKSWGTKTPKIFSANDEEVLLEENKNARRNTISKSSGTKFDLQWFLNILSTKDDGPEEYKKLRDQILKSAGPFFSMATNGGSSMDNDSKIKILTLLSKIIIQHNSIFDKEKIGIDPEVKSKLESLGLKDTFVEDFDKSLREQSGFYYLKEIQTKNVGGTTKSEKLGFYTISAESNRVFIPVFMIEENKDDVNLPNRIYSVNNLKFNEIKGTSLSVSTNGKSRHLINGIFEDSNSCEIAILGTDLANTFEESDENHKFIRRNSGKAFFVIPKYAGFSTQSLLTPIKDGGSKAQYLIYGRKENRSIIPYSELIGVQQSLDLDAFLEIMHAKRYILGKNPVEGSEDYRNALDVIQTYFGPSAVVDFKKASEIKTGALGDPSKAESMAEIYSKIRPYNALHWQSSSKFFSALLRFLDGSLRNDYGEELTADKIRSRFYQALWENLNNFDDRNNAKTYKSAIAININGTSIVLDPKSAGKGNYEYRIIISHGKGEIRVIKDLTVPKNIYSLDIYEKLKSGEFKSEDLVSSLLKALLQSGDEDLKTEINSLLKDDEFDKSKWEDETVSIGFVKIKRDVDDISNIEAVYQGFDEDLARACTWLLGDDFEHESSKSLQSDLQRFLKDDTLFKHGLFASIVGNKNINDFWKTLSYKDQKYLTTDVIAYFEAAYTLGARGAFSLTGSTTELNPEQKELIRAVQEFENPIFSENGLTKDERDSNPDKEAWVFNTPIKVEPEGIEILSFTITNGDSNQVIYKISDGKKVSEKKYNPGANDNITKALKPWVDLKSKSGAIKPKSKISEHDGMISYTDDSDEYTIVGFTKVGEDVLLYLFNPSNDEYFTEKILSDDPDFEKFQNYLSEGNALIEDGWDYFGINEMGIRLLFRIKSTRKGVTIDMLKGKAVNGNLRWESQDESTIEKSNIPEEIRNKIWAPEPKPTEVKPEEKIDYKAIVEKDLKEHMKDLVPATGSYEISINGNDFSITFTNADGEQTIWKGAITTMPSGDHVVSYTELPDPTKRNMYVMEIQNLHAYKNFREAADVTEDIKASLSSILFGIQSGKSVDEIKSNKSEFINSKNIRGLSRKTLGYLRDINRQIDIVLNKLNTKIC
jgi:thymidine kinase